MEGFSLGIEESQPEALVKLPALFFGDKFMRLQMSWRGIYSERICLGIFLGLEEAIVFCNFEESERICLGNFFGLEEANVYCNFVEWWECYTPTSIAEMEEEVTT